MSIGYGTLYLLVAWLCKFFSLSVYLAIYDPEILATFCSIAVIGDCGCVVGEDQF